MQDRKLEVEEDDFATLRVDSHEVVLRKGLDEFARGVTGLLVAGGDRT